MSRSASRIKAGRDVESNLERLEEIPISEDSVDQMLVLAERLRQQNGGQLDDNVIQAVSEATGAPLEYVRLAVKLRSEKQKRSLLSTWRAQFLTLEPETRRYVAAGMFGTAGAALTIIEAKVDKIYQPIDGSSYGVFAMVGLVAFLLGLYNVAIARDSRVAAVSGAILTGSYFVMRSLFAMLLAVTLRVESILLIPVVIAGAVLGLAAHRLFERNRNKLGLKDPLKERQELLKQLHELRDKLHSGEQSMTFLSVDIVGSTRMKQNADPLAVEFTFNEYHHYVERITRKHGGRVHSTAGDGVICAFDHPQSAFSAAKNIQGELIELNTHRNKIGIPIAVRCGVHSGTVVAPDAEDVTKLNFAEVIDIAAHLQKASPVGGIAVSEPAASHLIGGMSAVGPRRLQTMEIAAAVWLPKQLAEPGLATPPPIPNNA